MLSTDFVPQLGLQLCDVLPEARPFGATDVHFQACTARADAVRPGDLYVAVDCGDYDGHQDASLAEQRGATAIVAERFLPVQTPQFLVHDSRSALARIGHALAGHPSRHTQVVAIVDGAQTVTPTVLVSAIFERFGITTSLANELGACNGYETDTRNSPLQSTLMFARWLAESHANQVTHAIIGVTPSRVVQRTVESTELSHVVLTGLRPDRGVGHASPRRAAEMLLRQLAPEGLVIYNRDDLLCCEVADSCQRPCFSFGLQGDADVRGEILEKHRGEQTLIVETEGNYAAIRSRPFGLRHASFCLAALATGLATGVDFHTACAAIEQVDRLPLSLEPMGGGQPFGVYLDAANDPWSVRQCLKALKGTYTGKLIVVASCGHQLSSEENAILGRTIELGSGVTILSADPHDSTDQRYREIHQVLDGFQTPGRAVVCPDRAQAVRRGLRSAEPGDVLLITGCRGEVGQQSTRVYDRQVIDKWLQQSQHRLNALRQPSDS